MADRFFPQPKRSEYSGDDLEAYDRVIDRFTGGKPHIEEPDVGPYFSTLLAAPRFAANLSRMGELVRDAPNAGNTYSHADRELVDQVLAYDWNYFGFMTSHTPDAIAAGIRLEAIEAIRDGRDAELTAEERQLVDYVRRVVSGTVTDNSFETIVSRFGRRGAVEYTIFIAYLALVFRLWQAFNIPSPPRDQIENILRSIRDGTFEVPSFEEAAHRATGKNPVKKPQG
jgi:hypothetical protein